MGGPKLQALLERLTPEAISADLRNADCANTSGLNNCCGADYLQKERRLPAGFQDVPASARCADGDTFIIRWKLGGKLQAGQTLSREVQPFQVQEDQGMSLSYKRPSFHSHRVAHPSTLSHSGIIHAR